MTDYGHDVEFGLFPTPGAAHLPALLDLVSLAEVLGVDLVSIQDHPYHATFVDMWTLLSYLGARTSSIRLSPTSPASRCARPSGPQGGGGRAHRGHRRHQSSVVRALGLDCRRALSGEQLAGLTLDEGMSTFILGTDDPDMLRRFAAEVMPGVRDLVDAERAAAAPGAVEH